MSEASGTATLFEQALGKALNGVVRLDPFTTQRVSALAGKVVALELSGVNLTLFLLLTANGIDVRRAYTGEPDARLTGTPLAFARLGLTNDRDLLHKGEVRISGDTALGQQLRDIVAALDIDWEERLSRFTGDVIAHQLGNAARGTARWARNTADALTRDSSDYLRYEKELLPDHVQVDDFLRAVDTLRDDVERLEARVRRLQKPINNKM